MKSDIEGECSRYGQVLSVTIPRSAEDGAGNVFVEYADVQQACTAATALIGRKFKGRIVRIHFVPASQLADKKYTVPF